jgi:hypothetical protein
MINVVRHPFCVNVPFSILNIYKLVETPWSTWIGMAVMTFELNFYLVLAFFQVFLMNEKLCSVMDNPGLMPINLHRNNLPCIVNHKILLSHFKNNLYISLAHISLDGQKNLIVSLCNFFSLYR